MRVFRWLGRFALIAGPVLVLLIFVLAAFLMWVLVTTPGSRWAVTTGVEVAGGRVQAVQGSVWNGLSVGVLELDVPGASLRLEHLELKVEWPRLLERQLHIDTLRADTVWVDLKPVPESPDDPPGDPFDASSLP